MRFWIEKDTPDHVEVSLQYKNLEGTIFTNKFSSILCQILYFSSKRHPLKNYRSDPIYEPRATIHDPGDILIKGPSVRLGYWNNPEEMAHQLKVGRLSTGDIAEVDKDGNKCSTF